VYHVTFVENNAAYV